MTSPDHPPAGEAGPTRPDPDAPVPPEPAPVAPQPDPAPVYYYAPPAPVAPPPRPRRWLVVLTVAWAVVLAGAALWSVRYDGPTDREQTTVGEAKATADRLAADVVVAAGPGVVADVGTFGAGEDCRISLARRGLRHSRVIDLFTAPGAEQRLIQTVAAGLPAAYGASAAGTAEAPRLRADGGNYVLLTGTSTGPGLVRLTIDTGCRQKSDVTAEPTAAPAAARAAVTEVLTALGSPAVAWRSTALTCPNGRPLWTVAASGPATGVPAALDTALARVATTPVVAAPDRLAWRAADLSVSAHTTLDTVTVAATTAC
ncbi:hypothetical protein [Luedemannella helvata]|uniref:Uncharacterized protein n=1 Tax=Luedemannella helvata TaxID=349315 RepID=A0ABP4XAJ8_9ACTN